jgi:hypothetical protein
MGIWTPTSIETQRYDFAPGGSGNEYNGLGSDGVPLSNWLFHIIGFMADRNMCGIGRSVAWMDETLNWYLDGPNVFTITGAIVEDENAWKNLAHEVHS